MLLASPAGYSKQLGSGDVSEREETKLRQLGRYSCSFVSFSVGGLLEMRQMLRGRYLQQAEHGVAHVEAVPPVVVGDVAVTLPHCVHPPGQRLGGDKVMRMEYLIILEGFEVSHGHDLHLYKNKTPKQNFYPSAQKPTLPSQLHCQVSLRFVATA